MRVDRNVDIKAQLASITKVFIYFIGLVLDFFLDGTNCEVSCLTCNLKIFQMYTRSNFQNVKLLPP